MPSIGTLSVKLAANTSGFTSGLQQAAARLKNFLPGGQFLSGFKNFLGPAAAMVAVNKGIDVLQNTWNWATRCATAFREQAKEANTLAGRIGVTSQSLFTLQAASKGALGFDAIGKVITRYNLAAADLSKSGLFAALGLDRRQITGNNAVEKIRALVGALEGFTAGQRAAKLKELLTLKPDAMTEMMSLFNISLKEFDKRVAMGKRLGFIPDQQDLDKVKEYTHLLKIQEWIGKGIERKVGAAMMGPELEWNKLKSASWLAGATVFEEQAKNGITWGPGMAALFGGVYKTTRQDLESPAAKAMAIMQGKAEESAALLDPIKKRLGEIQGTSFEKGLAEWAKAQKDAGLSSIWVKAQVREARRVQDQIELETKLKRVREENVPPLRHLTEQMDLLGQEFARSGDQAVYQTGLDKLRQSVGALDSPMAKYAQRMRDISDAQAAAVINAGEWQKLSDKARTGLLGELGISRNPAEAMRERIGLLNEAMKGKGITGDERARGIAGLFRQLYGTTPKEAPVEGLHRGTLAAARAVQQWQMEGRREGLDTQEQVRRIMEQVLEQEKRQTEAAHDLAAAVTGMIVVQE